MATSSVSNASHSKIDSHEEEMVRCSGYAFAMTITGIALKIFSYPLSSGMLKVGLWMTTTSSLPPHVVNAIFAKTLATISSFGTVILSLGVMTTIVTLYLYSKLPAPE